MIVNRIYNKRNSRNVYIKNRRVRDKRINRNYLNIISFSKFIIYIIRKKSSLNFLRSSLLKLTRVLLI